MWLDDEFLGNLAFGSLMVHDDSKRMIILDMLHYIVMYMYKCKYIYIIYHYIHIHIRNIAMFLFDQAAVALLTSS